jgi:hypothetical protein
MTKQRRYIFQGKKAIVVIDAGISTETNLQMIMDKGYDYVCVSRSDLKKYSVVSDVSPVKIIDNRKCEIKLVRVQTENSKDKEYYLQITSPTKALKESSMYSHFMERFEEGIALIRKGIKTKGSVKHYDKVNQLKVAGCNSQWREIVCVMNTQKCVTAIMTNNKQERVSIRCCSKPANKVANIYNILKLKHTPFNRKKSVVLKSENFKNRTVDALDNSS